MFSRPLPVVDGGFRRLNQQKRDRKGSEEGGKVGQRGTAFWGGGVLKGKGGGTGRWPGLTQGVSANGFAKEKKEDVKEEGRTEERAH